MFKDAELQVKAIFNKQMSALYSAAARAENTCRKCDQPTRPARPCPFYCIPEIGSSRPLDMVGICGDAHELHSHLNGRGKILKAIEEGMM